MKTIIISKGKTNDAESIYYLSLNPKYYYLSNEVLMEEPISPDVKIILKSDSGWYPGTINEMNASNYNFVIDSLLAQEIIDKCKSLDGCPGYCRGKNY